MTNPFDVASHPKSLVNISTGLHAPTEIEVALTNVFDNGNKMVKAFVNGALLTFFSLFRLRGILRLEQVLSERKESSL
jgi:hypothetical protein